MSVVGAAFAAVLRLLRLLQMALRWMLEENRDSFEHFVVGILEGPRSMLTKCLPHTRHTPMVAQ